LSREEILKRYDQEDKSDVANSFRWQVLLAILKDELYIEYEAHGVDYEFQSLEQFLVKWWSEEKG